MENRWHFLEFDISGGALKRGGLILNFGSEGKGLLENGALNTVKPRKQEHSKIGTCRLILWEKTPKYKNQIQTDLLQCSYGMVHYD